MIVAFSSCKNQSDQKIDFSTDVKPIINKHCITCHGGVKRQADFSLLFRQDALDTTESGKPSIIPGDAGHSELIRRITSNDPEERMPYKENPLSKEEIEILRKWIDEGAKWGNHWAYVAPRAVEVPSGNFFAGFFGNNSKKENPIDYFIDKKLKEENLKRSSKAEKSEIIRRVYLDLIGVPPSPEKATQFINNESDNAYEKVVDELLASPQFGEKWASWWLDFARYSDTKGYERDAGRNIWRFRDYVIQSFNNDKPFDQFTIEQLAGDLLPKPTDDQYIATAFHRNTMNNDEGGTEDEEFRVASTLDRLNTTFQVWQSTTFACVQCHSHPYDPFRNEEYYKVLAFFNNSRDEDTYGEHPLLRMYNEKDQRKLDNIIEWVKKIDPQQEQGTLLFLKTLEPKIHPHDFDQFVNGELIDTKFLGIRHGGSARLTNVDLTNKSMLIFNHTTTNKGGVMEIHVDQLNGPLLARVALPSKGWKAITSIIPISKVNGNHTLYFKFNNPELKEGTSVCSVEWVAFREDIPGRSKQGFEIIARDVDSLLNHSVDNTPIMIENTERKRATHVFERGNWLVHGAVAVPEVPKAFNLFPQGEPYNRLGFAKWLVDKSNPLTARTIVNRVWEQLFGIGLVETSEDFGTQGAKPSHPELLDYLALRLMNEHHWSLKKLMKDIVISDTYQQQSRATDELLEKDPLNKLLARGPRIRLSAEQIRDQALTISGLLSKKMYGPSIMPYQPDGVWQSVWSDDKWLTSKGEDQYRRGVYIYTKRTSPYPSMMTFDGSSREVCTVNRIRANTPLQALVTLNDPVYVDAAKAFAKKMLTSSLNPSNQITFGYESALFKSIANNKLKVLTGLYNDALDNYKKHPDESKKLVKEAKPELAALTIVASAILNLDELITN
jgi:hypothetical protein